MGRLVFPEWNFPRGIGTFRASTSFGHMVCVDGFTYRASDGTIVEIQGGFFSDGSSIPGIFWSFVGHPYQYALVPSWIHDKCYRDLSWQIGMSREKADWIFNDAMKVTETPDWARKKYYRAVRLGGGRAYKRYRKNRDAGTPPHVPDGM